MQSIGRLFPVEILRCRSWMSSWPILPSGSAAIFIPSQAPFVRSSPIGKTDPQESFLF